MSRQPTQPQTSKPTTASFPMNAYSVPPEVIARSAPAVPESPTATAENVANVELAATPATGTLPTANVECPCGQILVHVQPDGAAILRVYERNILRPHTLTEADLPLDWRCPACGQQTRIG